ncbi:murein hydrolase activator EnvC family protein [Endozoicomonas numazuensis]|uniref:murein hydrolase activator EnvC family protein n=1 Tax=Endozoicomonas numazuensis TaxID=1137799 RepID=UPI00068FCEA7|nr:peptidoglycan DD-metalloendopeptidase family protein [Endozoicomonas numazuensis]
MRITAANLMFAVTLTLFSYVNSEMAHAESVEKGSPKDQLEAINGDIEHLRKLLEKLNKERSSAERQLQSTETEMSQLQNSIRKIEKELKQGKTEIKKLQSRQKALTAQKNKEKDRIANSVRSVYLASRDNRLKLLLNQENPEEVSRHLTYLKHLQKAQLEAIETFEKTLAEIEDNKQQQQVLNNRLEEQQTILAQKQEQLIKSRSDRQQLISRINRQFQSNDRELDSLNQQKKQLEEVLAQLAARKPTNTQIQQSKGRLPWPVNGRVLYGFNQQRADTRIRWQGILISAATGTQVAAIHDGTVIFSDWLRGYGQLIIVDHGNNYLSLYAHNQWLLKKEGETVLAGEALALSGQSGGQTEPGVYLEIRHNGKPQNPVPWLARP